MGRRTKLNKATSNLAEAKKIALKNEERRTRLGKLLKKAKSGKELTPKEALEARKLVTSINNCKNQIKGLGFNPKEASDWAKFHRKNRNKPSAKYPKKSKGSGVGMYQLGGALKNWR